MTREELFLQDPRLKVLEDHLLTKGGDGLEPPYEHVRSYTAIPEVSALLERGCSFDYPVRRRTMERQQCHKNTVALFLGNKVTSFATGFALHSDERWYYHSWGIRAEEAKVFLVETTGERFTHYFGVEYSGEHGDEYARKLYWHVTGELWSSEP